MATGYWDTSGSMWTTEANWSVNSDGLTPKVTIVPGANDIAYFNNDPDAGKSDDVVRLNAGGEGAIRTVGSVVLRNAGTIVLTGGSGTGADQNKLAVQSRIDVLSGSLVLGENSTNPTRAVTLAPYGVSANTVINVASGLNLTTYNGIYGSGSYGPGFEKTGAGTWAMWDTQTVPQTVFDKALVISQGVVELRGAGALGQPSSAIINGGSLHCYVTSSTSSAISVQGTSPVLVKVANVSTPPISLAGTTTIQVDSGWVSGGNLGGVTGNNNRLVLSGSGAQVIVNLVDNLSFGTGGLTLSGAAPWAYLAGVTLSGTGATIINDGRLDLAGDNLASPGVVASTSAIQLNSATAEILYRTTAVARDIDNAISGIGKITSGRCKFSSMSGFNGTITQTYTEFVDSCQIHAGVYSGALSSGSAGVVWDSDANQEFAGVINGAGGFTKRNTSVVTLSAANTYAGATTVTAGELVLASGGRCGSGGLTINPSGKVTVQNGGTIGTGGATVIAGELQTHGAQTYPASLTLGTGSTLTIGGA